MTEWPECEFIVIDGAEGGQTAQKSLDKTGWEGVIFLVEDEERLPPALG